MRFRTFILALTMVFLLASDLFSGTCDKSSLTRSENALSSPTLPGSGLKRPISAGSPLTQDSTPPVPAELKVPMHIRLMVIAPHPDDETLAAGGLIQRVLENEGTVEVVFVTNGDANVDGVRQRVNRYETSTADFIQYGEGRLSEALKALQLLGLKGDDGIFLGFPDDGIDELWYKNWSSSKPYTSPWTRFDRARYRKSFCRLAKYAGSDLQDEINRCLREFNPDWIVLPDPRDTHPDHCTSGLFVLNALHSLREEGSSFFEKTEVFTYLVHYPTYPSSPSWTKKIRKTRTCDSKKADLALSTTKWKDLTLTTDELAVKYRALMAHQSQVQMMYDFLKQFLRYQETFGHLDASQAVHIPREYPGQAQRQSHHK